jgi:predicted SnoaL-like aldol condensation-catalyzing enzyme
MVVGGECEMSKPTLIASIAIVAALSSGCRGSSPIEPGAKAPVDGMHIMNLEENKALATRVIIDIFNEQKYETASACVARNFHSHNPRVPPGPQGIEAFARGFAEAFAGFHGDIQDTIAEGDKVVLWIRWRGTHTGRFGGIAATGNQVEFETVEIFRVNKHKLVEHWDVADRLALQMALSAVQPATSSP